MFGWSGQWVVGCLEWKVEKHRDGFVVTQNDIRSFSTEITFVKHINILIFKMVQNFYLNVDRFGLIVKIKIIKIICHQFLSHSNFQSRK